MGIQAKFKTPSCTIIEGEFPKRVHLRFRNFSLLRYTASSALRANRSISIQLHYPRLESTAFLSYSGAPKYTKKPLRRAVYLHDYLSFYCAHQTGEVIAGLGAFGLFTRSSCGTGKRFGISEI
jgi:hypothetical protein